MIFALITGLMSCGGGDNTATAKSPEKDRVEVIYFHGKQRCATCMAIEKNAKEVVNTLFQTNWKTVLSYSRQLISQPRREKRSQTGTKLRGHHSLSINGKAERKPATT